MKELKYLKDYKHDESLRKSFNELAAKVFGINFEGWYQKGFWNNRYIPFSYIDGSKVVANVSVNVLNLVINGEKKNALQIGTVMTHPDYRRKGLSASLINKILDEYENEYDYMYLFANQTVLDFYPKFGFKPVNEYQFSMEFKPSKTDVSGIRKLNGLNTEDLHFIYEFASERLPVSKLFGTENTQGILMFYCMYVFNNDVYYLDREDVIVIYKKDENQIDIFDIISKKEINIQDIFSKITDRETIKIVFHYTPDYEGIKTEGNVFRGTEVLFVRAISSNRFPIQIKHPLTAQA
ncbi:GNAT family N-acetyltransferase [Bacillus sp. AFS076308]|uniref:GNAT family N-acetyltransferase n=1 Tax=unclassified Bacillus (in: firmicutes) TaxID=185979 RepID=UPI000BF80C0E|nr:MULTISPECIES: GNAT family N-acetyltransferase [unclassified Bacillus (in: firmicutes)]PFN96124.1 GNAT family N-acetyltransferase [Bacillus sp. AFS076308]PGV56010.1 GNAT family N-acetyltransferase [Bacillus sp. AFS037270]